MPVTPAHTSTACSGVTKAPSRSASRGVVDSAPPTHRSYPGPSSGCTTPTKEMSLISCTTSRLGWPVSAVLNLRGRLLKAGSPTQRSAMAFACGVGSMISSAAMPATGLTRKPRGVSPQASVVLSPTAASRVQISGRSSTRSQWNWMFCRSVMSAVSRANSTPIPPSVRTCSVVSCWPSMRTRIMKQSSLRASASSLEVWRASMPCLRCV